ncbi:MAG: hypothetical protein WEA58_11475 [Balneolaceae bacterium]
MALSTALMLAPSAIKLGSNLLGGGSKPSDFENRLGRMADIFESDAAAPITENREFKSGKTLLDQRDRDNRKMINNQSAITGGTDEAKLANTESANESYNQGLNQLLSIASRFKDRSQDRHLNLLGAAENARANRVSQYGQNLNSILDPVSEAGKAFAMADLFANPKKMSKKDQGTATEIATTWLNRHV